MTYPSEKIERTKLIEHMLNSLETPAKELTKWEEDFVDSVKEFYSARGFLSDRQIEVLERLYSEKTA